MNYALLAGIVLVFAYQVSLGAAVESLVEARAFVPSELTAAFRELEASRLLEVLRAAISSMFLHGGWLHALGNLLYLRVFGDNVEDRLGHVGFLLFYLASGLAGALGQCVADPASTTPIVGASGAIAGVLGAYVVLFPAAKVVTLFPVFIFLTFIEVPAILFLGVWSLQQLLNGYFALDTGVSGGVAWFAHLGGFALGVVVGIWARSTRRRRRSR